MAAEEGPARPPDDAPAKDGIVELENWAFRLGIAAGLGGSLTHLEWRRSGRTPVDLLRRGGREDVTSGNPSRLGSFVMVPFTNRIDGGRLNEEIRVPINRSTQNVAIHGFGRTAAWSIGDHTENRIALTQKFQAPGNPYVYEAEQVFELGEAIVTCSVAVINRGTRPLPFGIGFHPWFDRTAAATLALEATHAFRMDPRDMPLEAIATNALFARPGSGDMLKMTIAAQTPFDTPLSGWGGRALITWPERDTELTLTGLGALRLVHIFSPSEPAVFCVEPVSHLPDVVNRRHLAQHGDMTLLAPGERLSGAMLLSPRSLTLGES